jgi:hypothetical protein
MEDCVSVQKKSLISRRSAAQKAIVAKPEISTVAPTQVKSLKVSATKVRPARVAAAQLKPTRVTAAKVRLTQVATARVTVARVRSIE